METTLTLMLLVVALAIGTSAWGIGIEIRNAADKIVRALTEKES